MLSATHYLVAAGLLPLFAFVLLLFLGRRIGRFSGALSATLAFCSLGLSVAGLIRFVDKWTDKPGGAGARFATHTVEALTHRWINLPEQSLGSDLLPITVGQGGAVTVGILVDPLTVVMCLLVTFLAFLAQLYAIGYLGGNPRGPRFFAKLNLLVFSMVGLLMANSLPQMFVCWQLIGIATWLLVAFEQDRRGPVSGAFEGFLFNRLGDAAFLAGMGVLLFHLPSPGGVNLARLSFYDPQGTSILAATIRTALGVRTSEFLFFTNEGLGGLHWLTWTGILFLVAALVKSAQFPFQSWLANSAEGPAPASALIQTCTTTAAGVFLVARVYPLLTLDARLIMAVVGCLSLAIGALVACAQTDLRRILAWLTVSNFGYVLLFLGSGAYMPGLLHLFTHAFLKAALVMTAGNVGQAMQGQHDVRQLGGLWRRLPVSAAGSLIAVLAVAGTPMLAASYSANLGLACSYEYASALTEHYPLDAGMFHPWMLLCWIPLATTGLIAWAVGRWWWLTFATPPRSPKVLEEATEHPLGTIPLIALAIFAVGMLFEFSGILRFLDRSLPPTAAPYVVQVTEDAFQAILPFTAIAPACLALAVLIYFPGLGIADRLRRLPPISFAYAYLREGLYFDAFYRGIFGRLGLLMARAVYITDRYVLGGIYRTVAFFTEALAHLMNQLDGTLDRPARTVAILLAPKLKRFLPTPPPPPPAPPEGERAG